MRRLRGRRRHPESGPGDGGCYWDDCSSPPPPPLFVPVPAPAPAPAAPPSFRSTPDPCPPDLAPSPVPIRPVAGGGRRDQGRVRGYGSPPAGGSGGGDNHHRRLVTSALAAVAAIAFVSLILLGVSVLVRRRQVRRRRQQALLAATHAAAPAPPTDPDDPEWGGGGGVVHHVWYIRTVGLDEAAISSIAATRYRAGAGLLGAADCTVCLGEFQDGELLRLLPKCGHAFHVPCIDTWLRAHVTCPLCRSDVLDPAVITEIGDGGESSTTTPADPVEDSNAALAGQADATSEAMAEHEQEENDNPSEASPAEEDQHEQPSLPDPPPQLPRPLPHNVRRAASMDAAIVSTAADVAAALERLPEAAPEEEQSGRRKRGTGAKASGSGHRSNFSTDRPAPVGIPRSFFSRHCRARSSVLPL